MSDKLYFAHPINTYGEPIEERCMVAMFQRFPTTGIENPNSPIHEAGYQAYKARSAQAGNAHKGMSYFYDEVLPSCKAGCVALPFLDGKLGKGVAGEVKWFLERGYPSYFIRMAPTGEISVSSVSIREQLQLECDDPALVLSVDETRQRVWKVYNQIKRPFEVAHLAVL